MHDLRQQAERLRSRQRPPSNREPPEDRGRRLATLARGEDAELRVTWDAYQGHPYLSLRLWNRNGEGQWWPDKNKGFTVKIRELPDFAAAVGEALDLAERHELDRDRTGGRRPPGSRDIGNGSRDIGSGGARRSEPPSRGPGAPLASSGPSTAPPDDGPDPWEGQPDTPPEPGAWADDEVF